MSDEPIEDLTKVAYLDPVDWPARHAEIRRERYPIQPELPLGKRKFRVTVTETVCITYDPIEIEATNEKEAEHLAQEHLDQGFLANPRYQQEDAAFDIE